jgi:hypothetical protein
MACISGEEALLGIISRCLSSLVTLVKISSLRAYVVRYSL